MIYLELPVKSVTSAPDDFVLLKSSLSSFSNSISVWMVSSVTAFSHSSRSAERINIRPDLHRTQRAYINRFKYEGKDINTKSTYAIHRQ